MNAPAAIDVDALRKRFGTAEVLRGVGLAVPPGGVLAVLGPSGCGKTTLLRTISGLERPDAGTIRLDGRVVAGPGAHVPPERRRVGMVFQDWALFPHLTVAQNVGYGLPRGERKGRRVDEVLEMVGLDGLGGRHPGTLSGGQQQRVALARALAPRPAVLLLDEPFSNLDATLRTQVRAEVARLLAELAVTAVFVTHDQDEAFLLGDEVAVMRDGLVAQQATPAELYARPTTPWVASFVGDANLVGGRADGRSAATPLGTLPLGTAADGDVQVLVRPEELTLDEPPAAGNGDRVPDDAGGVLGRVAHREFYGHDTVYLVQPPDGPPVRVRAGARPRFDAGDTAVLRYAGPPAVAFPAGDGPATTTVTVAGEPLVATAAADAPADG